MKKKVLIVASTYIHIEHFHLPYISKLSEDYEVKTMANGIGLDGDHADFVINFKKKIWSLKNFKLVKQIRKILEDNKFDIIFLNTQLASFFVRLAVKGMKVKDRPYVVSVVHGYLFNSFSNFIKKSFFVLAEKFVSKQTNSIVVMNDEDNFLARKYKFTVGGVYKINGMGVATERLDNFKNTVVKKNNDETVFCYIGELYKRKNQKFIIKFIKKLKEQNENPKLYLVGNGEHSEYLQNYAKKLNVSNNIVFAGYSRNIAPYLISSDYYISASSIEGLPFNIIEAMYMGKIVFASNIKGCSDIIKTSENAVLYNCLNLKDLISKYNMIKKDNSLKEKISANAKGSSVKYTINSVFDDNLSLFRRFINGN